MTMGEWVRDLRARTGLTQKALGERIGLKTNSVALLESGYRCPSQSAIILMRQMSDLLGMPEPPSCTSKAAKQD